MARYRFLPAALAPLLMALPASAQQGPIVDSSSNCEAIAHVNDAPGIAYTPGIDVDGNAVAPAATRPLPTPPIKITADLQRRFGIPANSRLFQGEAQIGYVTVQDGKAY